ncbi:MAG: hemerythrin domain-containing protein [Burkholderiales bacterium]|nr:MAG: hemerythrin domain-containing protein [Burkholderiales bacterium]
MNFTRHVPRMLDDEHRAHLELLAGVERELGRGHDSPSVAAALVRYLEHDVERHFVFEEQSLFPRLAEFGDNAVAALLTDEHDSIRAVVEELMPLARAAAGGSLGASEAPALRRCIVELVERQVAHIQKETMALLPMLDDLLDEDADGELASAYAGA